LHVDNNHWCGAVFDYRPEHRGIVLFDLLQPTKSKYYDECEPQPKNLFGEIGTLMHIKRDTSSRQPDVSSCGAAVLTFSEYYLNSIPMPAKPSPAVIKFLRLR
ncbi:hypothetical protein JG687_00018183, partial [Phytophthora cactorum]